MNDQKKTLKNRMKLLGNILFFGALLFLLFNTDTKAWVLRQLINVGLFKAEIKQQPVSKSPDTAAFMFYDATGNTLSTSELKDKVVFINFWATWCPPCRAEMPSLNALYNHFKNDKRIAFLFINEDDDPAKANLYLQEKKYNIPVTRRVGNIPSEIFSGTLPTTLVLDKEGKVAFKHEGVAAYNTEDFIQQLKGLL